MSGVLSLLFFMLLIGGVAFAPLGYFIYSYTHRHSEPFGNIERHGDTESPLLDFVAATLDGIKHIFVKK